MREAVINEIKANKLIAIARKVPEERLIDTVEALYKGGIRLVEVTFDQENPDNLQVMVAALKRLTARFGSMMKIGAGTVLTIEQVKAAAAGGAEYIISPNTDQEIIRYTVNAGLVSIPGALTPSEAVVAHMAGADFVKLFPAGDLGLGYIKALKGPLSHIPFLAVGGVDRDNIKDFLDAGLAGVGVGSNIVKNAFIKEGKYDQLTELALQYIRAMQ